MKRTVTAPDRTDARLAIGARPESLAGGAASMYRWVAPPLVSFLVVLGSGCIEEMGAAAPVTPYVVKPCAGPGAAGVVEKGPSTLPTAPRACDAPRPSGKAANLKVLDWAGFKAAVTFTFDDSQPSQIAHYPELRATGVPMTFFITTSANSFANYDGTWAQAVKDGSEMGNHSVHHCHADLSGCTAGSALPTLDAEVDQCTSYIVQHFGQPAVWTAASPFGDTGYGAPAKTRVFLNRGVQGGTIAPNSDTDPFNLPCHAGAANETLQSFNGATDEAHGAGTWIIYLLHTLTPTDQSWWAPIDIGTVTGSIEHAKSLGDVWIDSMANVGAYWVGQKLVASAAPTPSGASTTWAWKLPAHFPPGKYLRVTVDGGTLQQNGVALPWARRGYYEVALDAGALSWSP